MCASGLKLGDDTQSLAVKSAVADILTKMYTTKSPAEQQEIVQRYYLPTARFVDPLMDVVTPREIHLAFYSLIKLFSHITVTPKSATWEKAKPRLPADLAKQPGLKQLVVNNQQVYKMGKRTFDIDVNTYLTFDEADKVVRHEDVWQNYSFAFPGFMKKPNAALSSLLMKSLGWGKQIDAA